MRRLLNLKRKCTNLCFAKEISSISYQLFKWVSSRETPVFVNGGVYNPLSLIYLQTM